jgi:hypothetical protein
MVARALGIPMVGHKMLLKVWSRRPGASVALVFAALETFRKPEQLDARLVLLERNDSVVNVVATGSLVPAVPTDPAWELDSPSFNLDFAAYQIRDGEFAFGVRFQHVTHFAAGENTSEVLHLFRQDCSRLIDVLHTEVRADDVQRGPNDHSESASVIIVAPETTHGFHDIVVQRRFTTAPLSEDARSTSGHKSERSAERWKWSGERYEPSAR